MKSSRVMADLMVGAARFDQNRRPESIEVNVIGILSGDKTDVGDRILISSTEEAAGMTKESEAVSVISSIIAATAVRFPTDVFIKKTASPVPPFIHLIEEHKGHIDLATTRPRYSLRERTVREQWYWGLAVGALQSLRWANSDDGLVLERFIYRQAIVDNFIPYFLRLLTSTSNQTDISEMPKELFARTGELIQEFSKHGPCGFFDLLVCKMVELRATPLSLFGYQLYGELQNRYWHSRSGLDKEQILKKWVTKS